jgi:hypothetical protein
MSTTYNIPMGVWLLMCANYGVDPDTTDEQEKADLLGRAVREHPVGAHDDSCKFCATLRDIHSANSN